MLQPITSIGRSLYRIVFRAGSPQRIQYSDRLLLTAVFVLPAAAIGALVLFFEASVLEIGLVLFTLLAGTYIGAALLTRRASRARLRTSLLSFLLILDAAGVLLIAFAPATHIPGARIVVAVAVAGATLLGTSNIVQFTLASGRLAAVLVTLAFAVALGAFFTVLRPLLMTVFS
ncbi:MAG: hypothetical protein PVF57_19275 [Pseudomonadales bacterium]|jgi:hypothetical protein